MTRGLAIVLSLSLGLALPARGEELPGRSVELEAGAPAPFAGNLCDADCKADALRVRRELEGIARLKGLELQAAQAEKAAAEDARALAEKQRDEAKAARASWGVVFGTGGTALVVGVVVGLILGLKAK